jgi:hypothetical protein
MAGAGTSWTTGRRENLLIRLGLLVPVAIAAFVLLGFADIIPISVSSYSTAAGTDCSYCAAVVVGTVHIPVGENVTLTWDDTTGGRAGVRVTGPGGPNGPIIPQCTAYASSSGTCSFVSVQGNYSLQALGGEPGMGQLVTFTVTWYVALL